MISLCGCDTKTYWDMEFSDMYHDNNDEYVVFHRDIWHRIMMNVIDDVSPCDDEDVEGAWGWVNDNAVAYAFHLKGLSTYHNISNERYLPACVGIYGYPSRKISTGVLNPLYKYKDVIRLPLPVLPNLCHHDKTSYHGLRLCDELEQMLLKPLSEMSIYL